MKAYRKYLLKTKNAESLYKLLHKMSFIEMLTDELVILTSNLGFILSDVC